MTRELKFTGIAGIGDIIRGHDFMPRPGVGACYIEGKVLDDADMTLGCLCYKIKVTARMWDGQPSEADEPVMYVPHEVSIMEWDGRVELLTVAPATRMIAGALQEALETVANMQPVRKTIDLTDLKKWEN